MSDAERSLSCRGVRFAYAGAAAPLLADLDFDLRPGELVALLGANGSGKSTLCLLLAGLLTPQAGLVTLDGRPPAAWGPAGVQVVQQSLDDQVVAPTVREDAAFGPSCLELPADERARRTAGALAQTRLQGYEDRAVETLSGGELARAALAGALAVRPRYLLLDEPTAHLDPPSADRLAALLQGLARRGTGVLLVTHRAEEARFADRVAVLDGGRVVREGTPADVLYDVALLERCGLRPPAVVALALRLREQGTPVPGAPLSPEELAEALCRCCA